MNKRLTLILISLFVLVTLLLFSFKAFKFNSDAIWKIEEQRREHVYLFPTVAIFIHNKGSFFVYTVLENYLSYLLPVIFFYIFLLILKKDKK
ncbi:MAG: hypothetical protein M1365_17085 [Actinobacteria bacterium]|nr:hypothetical protein [Actinomycetota bacterium]